MSNNKVDGIIIKIAKENRNLSINEIKRLIKNEIRLKVDEKLATEIDIDYIMEVIMKNKELIFSKNENKSNYQDEKER